MITTTPNIEEVFYILASLREDFSNNHASYIRATPTWEDMAEEEFVSYAAEMIAVPFVSWLELNWDTDKALEEWTEVLVYELEEKFAAVYVETFDRVLIRLTDDHCRTIAQKLKLPIKSCPTSTTNTTSSSTMSNSTATNP